MSTRASIIYDHHEPSGCFIHVYEETLDGTICIEANTVGLPDYFGTIDRPPDDYYTLTLGGAKALRTALERFINGHPLG